MPRGAYYPQQLREQVTVDWAAASDWNNFYEVPVTLLPSQLNTVTLTGSQGIGTATGSVSGDGNDRRYYILKNFRAKNVEAEASFDVGPDATPGQLGLVVGRQGTIAVVSWLNIVFGITGQALNGVWEFDSAGTLTLNQGTTLNGFKSDVISAVAAAGSVTVKTRTPHELIVGSLVDLQGINAALPSAGAVTSITDALTFVVATLEVALYTGGFYRVYAWKSRAHLALRLIDNVLQTKQWLHSEGIPPWGDPNRTITNVLPAVLSSGHILPRDRGEVGFLVSHLASTKFVNISNFQVTNLDN